MASNLSRRRRVENLRGKLAEVMMVPVVSGSTSSASESGSSAESISVLPSFLALPSKSSELSPTMLACSETPSSPPGEPISRSRSWKTTLPMSLPSTAVTLSSILGRLELVTTVPEVSGRVTTDSLLASGAPRDVCSWVLNLPANASGLEAPSTELMCNDPGDSIWFRTPSRRSAGTSTFQLKSSPPSSMTKISPITFGSSPKTTVPVWSSTNATLSCGMEFMTTDVNGPTSTVGPPNPK
mmetsp:Transcript_71653/g.149523  ORF Transcript_71653/g.149523 Transcript_71653/m.149523 type:complete len:240 (+) Transcript_71653:781-1500(+)